MSALSKFRTICRPRPAGVAGRGAGGAIVGGAPGVVPGVSVLWAATSGAAGLGGCTGGDGVGVAGVVAGGRGRRGGGAATRVSRLAHEAARPASSKKPISRGRPLTTPRSRAEGAERALAARGGGSAVVRERSRGGRAAAEASAPREGRPPARA